MVSVQFQYKFRNSAVSKTQLLSLVFSSIDRLGLGATESSYKARKVAETVPGQKKMLRPFSGQDEEQTDIDKIDNEPILTYLNTNLILN